MASSRGDKVAQATLRACLSISPLVAIVLVVLALAASWTVTWALGGAGRVVPHWYYVPILFAAVRFGWVTAVIVALVAGMLAGPLTPLDVATGAAQNTDRWLTRAGFFVVIGTSMGVLVRFALPGLVEEIRQRRNEAALRRALEDDELVLHYQPIVEVATGRLHGVEALIRWQHPQQGELAPDRFLGHAEQGPLIHEIGAVVLRQACAQAQQWAHVAVTTGRRAPWVAINMSARELESPEVVDRVRGALDAAGVAPHLICIEVTESTLVSDVEMSVERLAQLKQLGVGVAVDDFGTGYSSLSVVHRYPLDLLKVDRSFLTAIDDVDSSRAVLDGVGNFARSLGLTALAEGVETSQQAALVEELGYPLAQGFWYGRPSTPSGIERFLRDAPTPDDT